jgi:hypothetical protein
MMVVIMVAADALAHAVAVWFTPVGFHPLGWMGCGD